MIKAVSMLAVVSAMMFPVAGTEQAQAAKAAKGGYAACKAKLSAEPPCSAKWTRACAAQCGSKF